MPNTVKLKRGTATQWAANNPVLASGEVGVELSVSGSPQALKIGNGTSTWNALPYFIKAGGVPQPIAYGNTGSAGTSVEFARADHKHETMAAPPTTPTTVSDASTNSTTSTSHTHALSGVFTKQRNFNFGEIHKFYSGTNGRSWLGLLNLTRFSFHPLNNALIMAGYVDWLYNLDRRADELGGDITFTQTANITPSIKTNLFTGVISQGCCTVDLTGVVESDPSTWAQFTIERTSGGNIFSSAGTASTLLNTIGFLSVMEGWGSIGYDTSHNAITSLLIEVKPTTGTYAGQWYSLYDHTEAMNHPLSLTRGICFSMTDQTLYTDGVSRYSGIRVSIRGGVPYSGTILRLGNFCVFSNYPVSDPANVAKALGQRGGKGYGTYTIVGSGAKALEIRTPSGAIVGTFRGDNPRLGIGTDAPSEAVDVDGNLRLRNIPTTVGTFCIEVDNNGVFRKRTFAEVLSDIGASASGHTHDYSASNHNHDDVYVPLDGSAGMTGALKIANTGTGAIKQILYLLNNAIGNNTGVSIDFGFSTAANYYHASIRAIRTNEGSSHASKLSFLVRPAVAGTGDAPLVELFHLRYKKITPVANLLAPLGIKVPSGGDPTEDIDVAGTGRFRGLAGTGIRILSVSATGVLTVDTVANLITYLGVALSGHDHNSDYLQLTGGTISGAMTFSSTIKASGLGYDIAAALAVKVLVLNATNDIRTMSKADFIAMVLDGHTHSYLPLTGGGLSGNLGIGLGLSEPSENLDVDGTIRTRGIAEGGTLPVFVDTNGKFFKKTVAQAISYMNLLGVSHDALFDVHGRVITRRFSDLAGESDELGKLAWLIDEKRMAYGLGYGKPPLWQYLGITKVFPTVNDLMSESPTSEGIIACAITEQIVFVSYWNGYDYEWRPLVNEAELLRRTCLPWASLPSSPSMGHFQISYDKDVISFYYSTGGWRHLPVDSAQRIANPDDDYAIDPVLDKLILVDCSNNDVMITMPVIAQSMGREFIIRHHKGANAVKIVGQSSNTVDGLSLIMLTTEKDFVRLINDGNSDWCLVGGAYS